MLTGLDILRREGFDPVRGRSIALLCNQASIGADLTHALDAFLVPHRAGLLHIAAVFGPQHGLWGHSQDNMIEWEGGTGARTGLPVYSLYGEHREPTQHSLDGVEVFVVDIPDIGARAYTFIWTLALCMNACQRARIPVVVLDRPNPIGGLRVEGPVLRAEYASFIGLHPMPMRHGLTVGEIARHLQATWYPLLDLTVIPMEGWERIRYADETSLPWVQPSPNMPCVDTAVVYPGMCLLEGTHLSEGRGTTRPFETFGAPFIDGWALAERLNAFNLPGVHYRPVVFEPTFDKHAGQQCGGCFVHVNNREVFEPVLSGIAVLREIRHLYPEDFAWKDPPFEYDETHMPVDILAGTDWVRQAVDANTPLAAVREHLRAEAVVFNPLREAALLYDRTETAKAPPSCHSERSVESE